MADGGVSVGLAVNPDGSTHGHYGGIGTCGSVWACPQCGATVAARRADELAEVMRAVDALGGSGFVCTFTIRHALGDRLGWNRDQRARWTRLEPCLRARAAAQRAQEKVRRRVALWDALTEAPGSTVRDLVDAVELSDSTVRGLLREYVEAGWVVKGAGRPARHAPTGDHAAVRAELLATLPGPDVARVYVAEHWTDQPDRVDHDAEERARQLDRVDHVCDVEAEAREAAELLACRGSWDAVTDGWEAVTSGGVWVDDQLLHGGLLGWAKVTEITDGANGWHVHVHALLCFGEDVTEADVSPIVARMFGRWKSAVADHGFDTSGDFAADGKRPGWDVRRARLGDGDLADYFMKLAHEVTGSHAKEGRRPGGRTPMQLLADAVEGYDGQGTVDRTTARWWEYEQTSDGRRQLTWSAGLRDVAGLGPEQTDEEVAAEEQAADERVCLPADTWGWVRATDRKTDVLDVIEAEGAEGLRRWLDGHGQEHYAATPAEQRPRTPTGRLLRRPSDRPPRWSDDARAVGRRGRGGVTGGA